MSSQEMQLFGKIFDIWLLINELMHLFGINTDLYFFYHLRQVKLGCKILAEYGTGITSSRWAITEEITGRIMMM